MGTEKEPASAWRGWQGKTIFISCAVMLAALLSFAGELMVTR